MTTLTAPNIAPALQALIDLRLDTIDRLLLHRLPRQDRLNIVSEVEAQIFELLGENSREEPSRDDVLAVLARLDPPEAYVPEEESSERTVAHRELPRPNQQSAIRNPQSTRREGRAAKTGGILGIASLALMLFLPVVWVVAMILESEELAIFGLLLFGSAMFVTGVLGLIFSIYAGARGAWSITGMITCGIALLMWLGGGMLMLVVGL